MTAEELVAKVKERCGDYDPLEATLWFIAVQEARAIFDSFSLKDLARSLLDYDLTTPRDRKELEEWVVNLSESNDNDWAWLDKALDSHFGVSEKENK